jgi:hypothetical protein
VRDWCPLNGRPGQKPVAQLETQVLEFLGVGRIHPDRTLLAIELDSPRDQECISIVS